MTDGKDTINFGASGYSDFTKHGDMVRKEAYIARHKQNEDWTKSSVKTAGWMNKHVLWNKPTLKENPDDINKSLKT